MANNDPRKGSSKRENAGSQRGKKRLLAKTAPLQAAVLRSARRRRRPLPESSVERGIAPTGSS
jgi:hypothetical protein